MPLGNSCRDCRVRAREGEYLPWDECPPRPFKEDPQAMANRLTKRGRPGRLMALIIAFAPAFSACEAQEVEPGPPFREKPTDYFGELRPGATPIQFAPGVVSTPEGMYGTVVFSPDQTQAFWAKDEHPGLFFSRLTDGVWTPPGEFPFPQGSRLSSPFFSHDGRCLCFLVAGRDADGMDTGEKIWVVEKEGDGWGEPRELDHQVNSVKKHWQFSLDEEGSVYFGGDGADIYVSAFREGEYEPPVRLSGPINTDAPESSPHISPDGEILLFDRWFQTSPYVRIMASFRNQDGRWSVPVDLSPYTRSEGNDSAARLSRDGKYLFFQSVREGSYPGRSVYWMDAAFIQDLREEDPAPGAG